MTDMQLKSEVPYVVYPFATAGDKVSSLDFLDTGVTAQMNVAKTAGGRGLTRQMLNGIGFFATLGGFLDRMGYPYGYDRNRAEEVGGYPKGAILCTEDNGYFREYVSLEDNNLNPLPTEADDGTYKGNEHWGPTIPAIADFFPDMTLTERKDYLTINSEEDLKGVVTKTSEISESGWYYIELNVVVWWQENPPSVEMKISADGVYLASILMGSDGIKESEENGRYSYKARCLLPLWKGAKLSMVYDGTYHAKTSGLRIPDFAYIATYFVGNPSL